MDDKNWLEDVQRESEKREREKVIEVIKRIGIREWPIGGPYPWTPKKDA